MSVTITKADGSKEAFEPGKLRSSLKKSGATRAQTDTILEQIEAELSPGVSTQAIYEKAFNLLQSQPDLAAAKYSMRRALFGLGPTGFPFEDFLARLFQAEGYTTQTRLELTGKCTTHELDVAAYNATDSFVAEAKFHSRPGVKSDLQVALYSYARMLDLTEQKICPEDICGVKTLYLITNTKFTSTAESYAACVGLSMLSWNYPANNTLQDRIEAARIYPITVLTTLHTNDKQTLLKTGHILCQDILQKPHILRDLSLSEAEIDTVLTEARQLCNS